MLHTAEVYKILHAILKNPYKVTLHGSKFRTVYKLMQRYEKLDWKTFVGNSSISQDCNNPFFTIQSHQNVWLGLK